MDLESIRQTAFRVMSERMPGERKEAGELYHHGQRVGRLVLALRKLVFPDDDSCDQMLTVAAWLHDVSFGSEDHARLGAEKTVELLAGRCRESEIRVIRSLISNHEDRVSDRKLLSDYAKLLQDADLLDHYGANELWYEFHKAAYQGDFVPDVIEWSRAYRFENLQHDRQLLNFDMSKLIFDDRCEFIRAFYTRFAVEGAGGIWNADLVLSYYFNTNN